jgi:hypothetical protein
MNFEKVLSFHLNRILNSSDRPEYINNVEKLEDIIYSFFPQITKDEVDKINADATMRITSAINMSQRGLTMSYSPDQLAEGYARKKLRIFMNFIKMEDWLIEKNAYGEDLSGDEDIDPVFWTWLRKRQLRLITHNQNWLCLVTGGTGSGKSYSAGQIANLMDPTFLPTIIEKGIKSRVAIGRSEDFMRIINDSDIRKGQVVLFDEAGVGIPSREWWDECNRMIDYVMQTFRHMNLGVIFTTPDMGYVDSHARKVFHDYLEAMNIDYAKKQVVLKPLEMQNNPQAGKIYYHYPKYKGATLTRIRIGMPPKEFVDLYEPYKKEFSLTLNREASESIRRSREKDARMKMTDEDIIKICNSENIDMRDKYKIMGRAKIGAERATRIQRSQGIEGTKYTNNDSKE